MRLGIDIGSTTVKLILLDQKDHILYSRYERHMSNVFETVVDLLKKMYEELGDVKLRLLLQDQAVFHWLIFWEFRSNRK